MSEKLTPQVGDRVRLVHENGDSAEVTIQRMGRGIFATPYNSFSEEDGWAVTEILPKPFPPVGSFITGVVWGARFVGLVTETDRVTYIMDDGGSYTADSTYLKSWDVVSYAPTTPHSETIV